MSDELKPCPFCGWGTICEVITVPFRHKCGCHACGASTASYRTWDEAVEAWNTRTPEQVIADELNAELVNDGVAERGTCRIIKTPSDSDYVDDWRYRCSECGCNIPVNERDPDTGDVINAANYCPNCGKRIRKKVGE